MNRRALSLKAYNTAADRTCRDLAGAERQSKLARLQAAYGRRREQLEFDDFVRFHRLYLVLGSRAIEREMASLSTPVEGGVRGAA